VAPAKEINRARGRRRRGRPPKDNRLIVTAILCVLRTGTPWRALHEGFGPWGTVYTRYRRWCAAGLWARMLALVARQATGALRAIDCSHIKLHQDGANPRGGQAGQAIGRTRGGLNTKLAAVTEGRGRVVAVALAAGQRHELHAVAGLVPCLRGRRAVADKAFAADAFRAQLRRQRTRTCIPPKRSRRQPAAFHRGYYRQRHKIENCFGRLKRHRRVGTRYDKLAAHFLGFVLLAAILDWLSHGF
jgi:transposase